ncbi:MAG: HD domain-containing protein [Proteobacteria bacterium]|nr:HD domain-containing protein [Pseudomonadota bacterium]
MRQPPGTINLEIQEDSVITQDPQVTHESNLEDEDHRQSLDAASPATGPGPADMMAENKTAAGTGLPTQPRPSLNRVLQDISASLGDLQAAVREAELQGEKDKAAAESDLVAADKGYQDLFDLAPDAYLVTDGQTIIAESNQAAVAMLKVDRGFLKGKPLTDFVAEADRPAFQAILIQVRGGGEKRLGEFRLQPGEGAPFAVSVNVSAQTDHRDQLVRVLWLLRDVRKGKAEEGRLKALLSRLKSSFHGIVDAVAEAVEIKDPQTAGHQRRVAQLAVAIAREMDFSLNRLEGIRVAGLLHDIGKIAIPIEILNKPGELNHLEGEFIKSHCQAGFDLLKNIDFPWPVLQAILQHHERLDGSGYPAGLTDQDIILEARILGVADVMAAMVCARSYGPAQGIDQALEEIHQKAGILYDPEVVDICLKLFVEKGFSFNQG